MTDLLRILPSFPTGPFASLLPAIEKQSVSTTDLLTQHPADLAKQTHIPLLDLKRFIAAVQVSLTDDLEPEKPFAPSKEPESRQGEKTEEQAPEAEAEAEAQHEHEAPPSQPKPEPASFISTLDNGLDTALGGGVPVGCITEFTGESGAGKTQFLLALSLAVQLPAPCGLGKQALYISTEAGLSTPRLAQMLANNPTIQEFDVADRPSLDNILSTVTPDLESQDHILEYQVPVLLSRNNIGLIVLDSVAANYRVEFESKGSHGSSMAARSAQLVRLGALLRHLARRHNIAVVVANQVADRFASASSPLTMRHLPHRPTGAHPESPLASRSMPPPSTLPSGTPASSIPFTPTEDGPPPPPTLLLDHQQRWFTGWGDEPRSAYSLKTPSLGLVWSTQIACRVALFKRPVYGVPRRLAAPLEANDGDGDGEDRGPTLKTWRRWIKIVFAPHVAASGQGIGDAAEFEVNTGGLKTVKAAGAAKKNKS
jgi:DNA repair protein RAD57